ncbi:calpain 8 S homeolog isoform X2 [Pelobates cultripes]|uniref:calpain-2 n=1 Tax=Pelobates cultripes TaxID=61616 RepID=A0AAD1R5C9_PELCU|nr:calpain 8 S homeolog isoform X2 [Pelobates cultripes]
MLSRFQPLSQQINKLKPTKNLSRTIEKLRDKILDLSLISVERQLRKLKLTYYMQGNKAGSKLPKATSLLPTTVALFHNWKQTTPLFLRNNDLLLAAPLQALSTKTSNIHLDNWLKQGITQVRSLLSAEGIKPFPDLIREFHIPSRELFSYLRLKNIIQESGISLREPDPTPPFIHKCMGKLPKTKALSLCYNTLLLHDKLSKPSYMSKWESDLGKLFSNELWHRAQRLTKQASHSLNQWETYCKLTMRWYLVPTKLARIYPGSDDDRRRRFHPIRETADWRTAKITNAYDTEAITSRKLVKGHAYSVTGAEEVLYRGHTEKLVRLRNPWGEIEWTGPWSDEAPQWNSIDPKVKAALDKQSDDGEFWMAYSDFISEYSKLEICNLTPDTLTSKEQHQWNITLYNGSWVRGSTAGGCLNYPATFWTNPQFRINLDEPDDDHDGSHHEPCCTVIVGLMQKNRRRQRKLGEDLLTIGFTLYKLQDHTDVHLGKDFFQKTQSAARSDTYINMREVSKRLKLPVGDYLIVPSTFEPFKTGDFCLRVFSEKEAKSLEVGDVAVANPYQPQITDKDVTEDFKSIFNKIAGEKDEVDAKDIQVILNKLLAKRTDLKSHGFSLATCREMISLMDIDGTGTLSLVEFNVLWMKLKKYMETYVKVDTDRSGTIDAHEMRAALQDAGFNLNNKIQQSITQRYADSDLTISFDGFIACMIRLETLFKMFQLLDPKNTGSINLTLPEWLCSTLV